MAKYTIELHKLIEMGYKLPLDEYPIFDEEYRGILNDKIIAHYYFREIGQETPSRFSFNLRRKMNEIMPYYNKLYESELIKYDPLFTTYFTSLRESEKRGQGKVFNENGRIRSDNIGNVYSGIKLGDYNTDSTHTNDEVGNETGTEQKVRTDNLTETGIKDIATDETKLVTEDNSVDTDETKKVTENNQKTTNEIKKIEEDNVKNVSETKQIREKDDKTTTSHSETDSTTTTTRQLTKQTDFSDVPQAGYETTTTTYPDGHVVVTGHGYLTTRTLETENENINVVAHSETDGTVVEDDTKTTNVTDTIRQTEDNEQNITDTTVTTEQNVQDTKDNIGQVEVKEQHTTDDIDTHEEYSVRNTGTQTTDTAYEKNFTDTNDYVGNEKTKSKENEDSQRNITENEKENISGKTKSFTKDSEQNKILLSGRQNVSPAELIKIYRDTLLNIDMQIVNELETLFMGVF